MNGYRTETSAIIGLPNDTRMTISGDEETIRQILSDLSEYTLYDYVSTISPLCTCVAMPLPHNHPGLEENPQ